jgi:long-chain fatty acid transport protein
MVGSIVAGLLIPGLLSAQGIVLPAGGAVNRGMGGATTGTAIEAVGSMYWNPATITRLEHDELGFGFELIYGNQTMSSFFPGAGAGTTDGETGAVPVPTIAWVHQTPHPDIKFGLGVFGTGGFSANIGADASNPILSPAPGQGGVGLGGIKSDALFFQLAPALSMRLTDRLSFAAGPVIGMGKVTLDDNAFVGANADGLYPRGDGTRYHWGMGAQFGVHYVHNCCWEFGANVKTPVWFEPFRYFSEDASGLRRLDEVDIDLPMIVSGGLAYKGFEYVLLTADLRYLDYTSTEGFGDSPSYQANGAANGLGWKDQFAMGLGAQFQLTERLIGRLGYIYTSELFDDESSTFFNLASDLSYRHVITLGSSFELNKSASISAAYNYLLPWASSGPYILPGAGAIPGTSVSTDFDAHILTVGLNVRY